MTNTNYWLVDMETRVIHLKSKELQDTQQVVGSSNVLRIQLLFRVVQYHLISVQSFLAAEPQLYLYLPDVSQTPYVHWLLYAILITPISCCTDILIFFLGNWFTAYKFLRHRETLNRISSLSRLLNCDVRTFFLLAFAGWWYHFPSLLVSVSVTFFLVWNSADLLAIFLFPCNASFQLRFFFAF